MIGVYSYSRSGTFFMVALLNRNFARSGPVARFAGHEAWSPAIDPNRAVQRWKEHVDRWCAAAYWVRYEDVLADIPGTLAPLAERGGFPNGRSVPGGGRRRGEPPPRPVAGDTCDTSPPRPWTPSVSRWETASRDTTSRNWQRKGGDCANAARRFHYPCPVLGRRRTLDARSSSPLGRSARLGRGSKCLENEPRRHHGQPVRADHAGLRARARGRCQTASQGRRAHCLGGV